MKDDRNAPGPDKVSVSPPNERGDRVDRPTVASQPSPGGLDTERLPPSEQASENERQTLESGEESAT